MKGLLSRVFGGGRRDAPKVLRAHVTIVSGLPRSGTSMMMKMLEASGLSVLQDQVRSADGDNPKGYYEFERVKRLRDGDRTWLPEAEGKVVKVISALLEYLPPSHHYRIVFVLRDLDEVMASQRRMLENRVEDSPEVDEAEVRGLYADHLEKIKVWMGQQANVDVYYVNHGEMIASPESVVPGLATFLGAEGHEETMVRAVDPSLYRQRVDPPSPPS